MTQRPKPSPTSTPGRIALAVIAGAVAIGAVLAFAGLPIWFLALGTALALTTVLGQMMPWASAATAALAVLLIALVAVMRTLPHLGADIGLTLIGCLTVAGTTCVAWLILRRSRLRLPSSAALRLAAQALPVPVTAGALAAVIAITSAGTRLSWGMNNDAATNTMLARYMWNNGGIDTDLNPNASPLLQALIVASFAPGRSSLDTGELLAHDLQRNAQLWIVVVLLSSLVAGFLVARATRNRGRLVRLTAAGVGAAVPLTWYVAGVSFQFGFMNAPLVVALLGTLWLVWTDVPRAPLTSLGILALLTTTLLAIWAPLAILPLALGAGVVGTRRTRLWRESTRRQLVWGVACGLQLLLYAGLVTVPDFLASGQGLSIDGGMADMRPSAIVIACSTALLVAVVGWLLHDHGHALFGVALLAGASLVAVSYLVYQRRDALALWGYYPAKFAWFVSILFILLVIAGLSAWVVPRARRGGSLALTGVTVVTALGLLGQVTPNVATFDVARAAIDLRPGVSAGSVDEAVRDLIAISDPTTRDLAVRLGPHDRFLNYWLVHMTTPDERDPIRMFAYVGEPDNLYEVCDAVETWGGDVTLHTRDPRLQESLSAVCTANFSVELLP